MHAIFFIYLWVFYIDSSIIIIFFMTMKTFQQEKHINKLNLIFFNYCTIYSCNSIFCFRASFLSAALTPAKTGVSPS